MSKTAKRKPKKTYSRAEIEEQTRGWGDVLNIWRLCERGQCRRAQRCRGRPMICFRAYFPLLPQSLQIWFDQLGYGQQEGMDWDEVHATMRGTIADKARERWCEAIKEARLIMAGKMPPPAGKPGTQY